jgi:hypothetical protein
MNRNPESVDQDHIDIYCERVGSAFWAEPLNAVSNLGFIVSAALLILVLHRDKHTSGDNAPHWILIALVFLIGIGSGLFHTLAVRWAMWADIIPITLFIVTYSFLALRRFVRLGVWATFSWTAVVLALTAGLPALTGLRGSTYLPAVIGMFAVGFFVRYADQRRTGANALLASGCIFTLSLGFRTLDAPLCDIFSNGTHFLWHLLNAVVLYILTRAMIQFTQLRASD